MVAPLWVAYRANLGTLMRTCEAAGACLAVPSTKHYREAMHVGNTLDAWQPCIHWIRGDKEEWVVEQQAAGWAVVAVELADDATPLPMLEPARRPTLVLLGHEHCGVPFDLVEAADQCVEIPMLGQGNSLNVAVAGSLVLYRLAGLS